jgi:hypothetical protein
LAAAILGTPAAIASASSNRNSARTKASDVVGATAAAGVIPAGALAAQSLHWWRNCCRRAAVVRSRQGLFIIYRWRRIGATAHLTFHGQHINKRA